MIELERRRLEDGNVVVTWNGQEYLAIGYTKCQRDHRTEVSPFLVYEEDGEVMCRFGSGADFCATCETEDHEDCWCELASVEMTPYKPDQPKLRLVQGGKS